MVENNILEEIEKLGELQFTGSEVSIMCELKEKFTPEQKRAYLKGQLKAEAEVRLAILKMAKQGSTPAQKQFQDLVAKRELENRRLEF